MLSQLSTKRQHLLAILCCWPCKFSRASMDFPRTILFLCFSWIFLILGTHQLQPSQNQVLLQLRKQLEYPNQLDHWLNQGVDLCYLPSPEVSITCQNNSVTEIRIRGDNQARIIDFNGYSSPDHRTLSQNFSTDSLVATLSRLGALRALSLVSLGIWGQIPDIIHRLQSLEYLDLSWNFLYGSIPQTLSRIGMLQILKLDGNFLNGTVPEWFDVFPNLTSLSLSNNQLHGPLPPTMPKGVIIVLLSNNSLSGNIPSQYEQLKQLQQLDMSCNALEGMPPVGLFALPDIASLNLASNMLSGPLPMQLSCSKNLGLVDISNNKLSGSLPSCLSSAGGNRVVKSEGNCLSDDLGNQHPGTYCRENIQEKKKSEGYVNILAGIIGGIAVILAFLAIGFLVLRRQYYPKPRGEIDQHLMHKSAQQNSAQLSTATKSGSQELLAHRLFSLDELKASTNNFDRSTLTGGGSFDKTYKGMLENGTDIAIRCLTVTKRYTIRNLKLRLDLLAKLRHPHLVCLLGHCIESDGKGDYIPNKVYLVYEYISNGNYRDRLTETDAQKLLKWADRLAILISIAKAVHFLHTGIIPGFYSNRLKSNNVLIHGNGMAKLSDSGLSLVAREQDIDKEDDGLESWQRSNQDDDVYRFGLILQESIVGPSVRARKELFLLSEKVCSGISGAQMHVVDPVVLGSCCQESLSSVISLTISCISPESSTRPSLEEIIWSLQRAAQAQAAYDENVMIGKSLAF